MNRKTLAAALTASVAVATMALAPSAQASLSPGNYNVAGIQQICLVSDGTWYGETFSGWGGRWFAGPTRDDGTLIFGNYSGGLGNDSMVVGGHNLDWTEWQDDQSFQTFLDTTITKIKGACSPPAAKVNIRKHPMD